MALRTAVQSAILRAHALRWAILALSLAVCACFAAAAQAPQTEIARISGDDIAVKGAVSVEVIEGRSTTVLVSGSDITVRSGQALITLADGGEIDICGPAHFTLLESGNTITVALDYGRVHPHLDANANFVIYTPQVVVTPITVGGGDRDLSVGLTPSGTMCVLSALGAARVELQLTGQSMITPQGGEMTLEGGQLQASGHGGEACACESPQAQTPRSNPATPPLELSVPARPGEHTTTQSAPPPSADEEPIYQVYMPPLTFNASSPQPPPDPSPSLILLVRRVRVRPAAYFTGVVEAAPAPQTAVASASPPPLPPARPAAAPPRPSLYQRIKNYFHSW
jgi:hypothetical protein